MACTHNSTPRTFSTAESAAIEVVGGVFAFLGLLLASWALVRMPEGLSDHELSARATATLTSEFPKPQASVASN